MSHIIKKKTKNHLTLRTNNYIENQNQKETFFSELYTSLSRQFSKEQLDFLINFLLAEGNQQKKHKKQNKNLSSRRILTLPTQRNPSLNEIDPNLFQTSTKNLKKASIMNRKTSINVKNINLGCMSTPRKIQKNLFFKNKKILDLDRYLQNQYETNKDKYVKQAKFDELIKNRSKPTINVKTLELNKKYNYHLERGPIGFNKLYRFNTQTQKQVQNRRTFSTEKNKFEDIRKTQFSDYFLTSRRQKSQENIPNNFLRLLKTSQNKQRVNFKRNNSRDLLQGRIKKCFDL